MSSSTHPDRPNRLVMGLGIATVVLFSVNLLAMLSQRVWPKLQNMELFESESAVEEVAPFVEMHGEAQNGTAIYSFVTRKRRKRCSEHRRHHGVFSYDVEIGHSLDSDLDRLEREIRREMDRLNVELSSARSDLEEAVTLKLHIDEPNALLIQRRKIDLADMEKQVEKIARSFEVRVQKYEDAARVANKLRRDRSKD
ncbi:MAG: hypothetical protein BMS9Abin05_1757 [Rhodothermia bacterium]|nr:MAG: hypothetical protein BMS9Abin05_1757 [Rhodothermia bacterium]